MSEASIITRNSVRLAKVRHAMDLLIPNGAQTSLIQVLEMKDGLRVSIAEDSKHPLGMKAVDLSLDEADQLATAIRRLCLRVRQRPEWRP